MIDLQLIGAPMPSSSDMLPPPEPGHEPWRELVFAYEDLGAEDRRRADAHLAECRSCTALLRGLQQAEGAAAVGALPETPIDLEARLAGEADASLHALRTRLDLPPVASSGAASRAAARQPETLNRELWRSARIDWSRLTAPLAAAAAVVAIVTTVLLRTPHPASEAIVRSARIERFSGVRGGDEPWQSGDAFTIELDLARQSVPVVVHVDPSGDVSLLQPADAALPGPALPAGPVLLPAADSGIEWRLEGPAGRETFLVAAALPDADLPKVLQSALDQAGGKTRDEAIRRVAYVLRSRLGPVQTIEIERGP